jgi:hypothetical protein
MPKFLVYVETQYYPWAEVVEAPSAETAPDHMENGRPVGVSALAICPFEHVTAEGDTTYIDGWPDA